MRALKVLAVVPLWFLLTADSPSPSPSASPQPAPTPVSAFLTLSISAGGPNSTVVVNGNSFNPNEALALFWDNDPGKSMGSTTTNAQGNFANVTVKPWRGAAPGLHHICASVNPFPCAQFQLQGTPTPTPATQPSPSPAPSSSASPSASPSIIPIPAGSNNNGLDLMLRPPFVFLPIIGLLALFAAVGYWVFTLIPRPQKSLPSASIVIRSARPTHTPINPGAVPPPVADEPPPQPPWPNPNPPRDE
jgi:hypothetical protein